MYRRLPGCQDTDTTASDGEVHAVSEQNLRRCPPVTSRAPAFTS